jgi:arylsulfatase A-like enzyme
MYPYTESLCIPLLVRWPDRIEAGSRTTVPHAPFDHLPTLGALAGIDIPPSTDGTDLSPLILGGEAPRRDGVLIMNYVSGYANFTSGGQRPEWRGVHTGRHTYVKWLGGREALFDNDEDPFQERDLAPDPSGRAVLEHLRSRLAELLAQAHDGFLPGTDYAAWYRADRSLARTALGPVP